MLIRKPCLGLFLVLQVFFSARVSAAMDMPHYDLHSLVYMSTDIVVATLSEDAGRKFTATVSEPLYGSLRSRDQLDTLAPFLTFYRPMENGMKVILFLDRRPKQYDFIHSDAAKSPFAIPPSGVYLIDDYQHVHEYFQEGNPGPYVAQGYTYFFERHVPTKEQDLALPFLNEIKDRIVRAVPAVQKVRLLLDKVATRHDAPALMRLVDRTSKSEKDCALRMATVIVDRAMEQIRSLNDPRLLLEAYSTYDLWVPFNSNQFIFVKSTTENIEKQLAEIRIRYLIQCLSNRRERLPLRVAALEVLLGLSKIHFGAQAGPPKPLPIDSPWLASHASEIPDLSKKIFDDPSENPQLRALCLQLVPLDRPGVLAEVKNIYRQTASRQLRFAIEMAFLPISDKLYESLNPPGGFIASRLSVEPECGCAKATHRGATFVVDWRERWDFGQPYFPHPALTNLRTGQHIVPKDLRMAGGWNRFPDGQWKFNLGTLSGVPAGDYSLAPEFASSEGVFSTGYGQEVLIRDTPTGKKLAVKKVGEN